MLRFLPWLLFVILAGAGDWHCEDEMTLGLLQVQTDVSETTQHISISPQLLHIAAGCIALVCLLLVLCFGSADALVSLSIFMDLFMTTILTPLAPIFTADYQLIALLTSSKNVVTCLIAPLAGHFVDNNEAKSMRLGMLCAMVCSLCFAMVQNYWFWLAVRCLSGCSTAAIVWGGFAYCNRAHADEAAARSRAMASATAGLYAGVILGPQAGGLFVEDPRSLFLLLLTAQLFIYFALRNRLAELGQNEKQMQKKTEEAVDMVSLIMDPDVRNPILALFLALAFIAALGSTTFEYMVRLGYDQMKQNLTWLLSSVPAILFTCMVPWLRSFVSGDTLQILAMLLGGFCSLIFFWPSYGLLAVTLLGASVAGGIIDGNTPAMLSDRSQAKYGGTGQVFVLSNVADQAAFILGPAVGSLLSKHLSFPFMCQSFGGCMLLYGSVMALGKYYDFANAKHQGTLETICAEKKDWKVATRCMQHRGDVDDGIGCLGIPIHLGQVFVYKSPGTPHPKGAIYGRFDHPTRLKLENCHGSQFSQDSSPFVLAFATYEAAVASLLARLRSKDQLLFLGEEHDADVGLLRFFSETAAKRSFRFQQMGWDQISSLDLEAKKELLSSVKLCWVSCADKAQLFEWSRACQLAGALLVMDASFGPDSNWELPGASVALHWCAVLSGRTDVYTCMLSTNDGAVFKSAQYFRQTMGSTPGNFECYLAFRGLLSLQCRMERQAASARYLVEQLCKREDLGVEEVTGTSFQLKMMDGSASVALSQLSLVCCQVPFTKFSQVSPERTDGDWPACLAGRSPSRALRTHAWLQGTHVLRVQVGLENQEDLLQDFSAAFDACPQPVHKTPEAKPVGFTSRMLQIAGNSSDEDDACARYPQREVTTLEKLMADAHGTRFSVTFASGSATYQVLLDEFLSPGDHVIASNKLYVGAFEAFQDIAVDSYGVTFTFLDLDDLDAVAAAISPKTRLLWVEAASNPLGHPVNLQSLVHLCRPTTGNASPPNTLPSLPLQRLLLVVDNTWCGPCMLRPALQGADVVIESLTKAIGGFSDLLLGAVCTDCAEMHIRLSQARARLGIGPARLDCDLATSSLLTYEARIEVMSRNARSIAKVLDADHRINKVHFLGFQGSAEMKNGPSNMIAFYLNGGKEDAMRFLENLKLIKVAGSFGDCCTIVEMPYTMFVDRAAELKCGVADNLMRLSVGLEYIEDLISDILNALSVVF